MVNYQKPKLMQPEKLILKFKLGEKSPENKREILKNEISVFRFLC